MPVPSVDPPKTTIAALDIGTNSAHLVIAAMDHLGEMRLLDSDKVILRLGQAIDSHGNLSDEAIGRTVETMQHMQEIIRPYGAIVRAVATHATREAANHRKLLKAIEAQSGIKVELIDGIEEARLSFLGMRYGLALSGVPCLGTDIGGGSTEIIMARDDDISYVSSFKLGAVTLTAKYLGGKSPSKDGLAALRDHVRSRLAPLPHEAKGCRFTKAIASSGTAKALAFIHARIYERVAIDDANGYVIPRQHLTAIVERLAQLLTPQRIKEHTGIDQSRADIILAGAVILDEVSRQLKVREWVVTSYGLREGLVADTFCREHELDVPNLPDVQWHSVLQFARRLRLDQVHAERVKKLAMSLHDQLLRHVELDCEPPPTGAALHNTNLKLLKAAAYLREAGKFLSSPQYHRHSQYLISNCRLPGFTERERDFMGLIARFQRKAIPSRDQKECEELSAGEMQRLRFLSGCLRLAAALDRTRQGRVLDVKVTSQKGLLVITALHVKGQPPDVEIHKARLELEALKKSFGSDLHFAAMEAR